MSHLVGLRPSPASSCCWAWWRSRAPPAAPIRPRRRFSPGSASTWPSGPCASTPIRSRIASGSTGSARAKGPTSASVNPAAAAAAIEPRRHPPRWRSRRTLVPRAAAARRERGHRARRLLPRALDARHPAGRRDRQRDSADGFDVSAHYLVDTITSASVAAGTGVDGIFTEMRNEVGARRRQDAGTATRVTLGYKYSAESDYWSHAIWASVAQRLWGDTATPRRSSAASASTRSGSTMSSARHPVSPRALVLARSTPSTADSPTRRCSRPVDVAQITSTTADLGASRPILYRTVTVPVPAPRSFRPPPAHGARRRAMPTTSRARAAASQLQYRYYHDFDPDQPLVRSVGALRRTVEARIYHQLTRDLDDAPPLPRSTSSSPRRTSGATSRVNPGCSATNSSPSPWMYYTSDPKLRPVDTEYPEVKLIWDAEALRAVPVLSLVRRRDVRDLVRPLLPERRLRQRPRAPDRLHDAILRGMTAEQRLTLGRSLRQVRAAQLRGRARSGPSARCCWGRCS